MKARALELRERQRHKILIESVRQAFGRSLKSIRNDNHVNKMTSARRFGWFMRTIGRQR